MRQHQNKSLHSKDIRFHADISNSRGDLYGSLSTSLPIPRTFVFKNISNTRGHHLRQHNDQPVHPRDIRFRAHISNTPGDDLRQHQNKSIYPKDIHFRARISNTPGDQNSSITTRFFYLRIGIFSFQGHPFSCAYCKH